MDSLDQLLAELEAEYNGNKPQHPSAKPLPPKIKSASLIDNLLAEVKADFEEKDLAAQLQKQQEIKQEQERLLKIKAQKQEAIKKQASSWLANLDPLSTEGIWFETFAEKYSSKLEAAVDYLQSNE